MNATQTYFDEYGEILTEDKLHTRYDDMLYQIWGTVSVAGYEFLTSRALKKLEPNLYDCMFNDWLDAELNETIFEEDPSVDGDEQ